MLKVARWMGFLASAGTLALYLILVFFNPYAPTPLTAPLAAMMLLALAGMGVAFTARPALMLGTFLALFVPVGFYLLLTPGVFRWIGVLNLIFLGAGLLMLAVALRKKAVRQP